ncbi:hypothetical protein LZ30DRAFT_793944 [Colletotrichum cereale]|nr:hypothetical protein LZ30DRAFT_793944 [Colletotrichum cereale]
MPGTPFPYGCRHTANYRDGVYKWGPPPNLSAPGTRTSHPLLNPPTGQTVTVLWVFRLRLSDFLSRPVVTLVWSPEFKSLSCGVVETCGGVDSERPLETSAGKPRARYEVRMDRALGKVGYTAGKVLAHVRHSVVLYPAKCWNGTSSVPFVKAPVPDFGFRLAEVSSSDGFRAGGDGTGTCAPEPLQVPDGRGFSTNKPSHCFREAMRIGSNATGR